MQVVSQKCNQNVEPQITAMTFLKSVQTKGISWYFKEGTLAEICFLAEMCYAYRYSLKSFSHTIHNNSHDTAANRTSSTFHYIQKLCSNAFSAMQ